MLSGTDSAQLDLLSHSFCQSREPVGSQVEVLTSRLVPGSVASISVLYSSR